MPYTLDRVERNHTHEIKITEYKDFDSQLMQNGDNLILSIS